MQEREYDASQQEHVPNIGTHMQSLTTFTPDTYSHVSNSLDQFSFLFRVSELSNFIVQLTRHEVNTERRLIQRTFSIVLGAEYHGPDKGVQYYHAGPPSHTKHNNKQIDR